MRVTTWAIALAVLCQAPGLAARESSKRSLDERLAQVERQLNPVKIESLKELNALQDEVRQLRGFLEEQQNQLQILAKRQQDLFLNLEKRLDAATGTQQKISASDESSRVVSKTAITPVISSLAAAGLADNTTTTTTASFPTEPAVLASTPTQSSERQAYYQAYEAVKNKQYAEAIQDLHKVIQDFPQGEYAAQSHYWLGEVYMTQWQADHSQTELLNHAEQEFTLLTSIFPKHSKTADAFLKLGLIEIEKENWLLARQHLNSVIERFPGTAPARMAEVSLERIANEGH